MLFGLPGYLDWYIVFVLPFVYLSVHSSDLPLCSWDSTSKFYVKCFQMGHILATTYQKGFILGTLIPGRVCFHSITFDLRVHAPGWGWRSESGTT